MIQNLSLELTVVASRNFLAEGVCLPEGRRYPSVYELSQYPFHLGSSIHISPHKVRYTNPEIASFQVPKCFDICAFPLEFTNI